MYVRLTDRAIAHRKQLMEFVAVGVNLYIPFRCAEHQQADTTAQVGQFGRRKREETQGLVGVDACRIAAGSNPFDGNNPDFRLAVGIDSQAVGNRLHVDSERVMHRKA